MTEASAAQRIRKGDFGTISAIGDKLEVRFDKGESVQLSKVQAKHIEHGYAVYRLKQALQTKFFLVSKAHSKPHPRSFPSPARGGR